MNEHPYTALFRANAVHQALWSQKKMEHGAATRWSAETAVLHLELAVYHGLWITKFPLIITPRFDVTRLDALSKQVEPPSGETLGTLIPSVNADVLRFVLAVRPDQWDQRHELFFGGRAINKPLWNSVAAWFEHAAVLRGRIDAVMDLWSTALV